MISMDDLKVVCRALEVSPDFDEAFYLKEYPDVAAVVATGAFASGWDHYDQHGRSEGRLSSFGQQGFEFGSISETALDLDEDEFEIKLRTFIPDPEVGLRDLFDGSRAEDIWGGLVDSGLINVPVGLIGRILPIVDPIVGYIVNRAETTFLLGDDRDFHYSDGTHRSEQKVVVTADPADRDGKVNDPVVEWGKSSAYGPLTEEIIDIPIFGSRIQLGQLVDKERTLTPTDDNNSVKVSRPSNNIVKTQFKLSGGIPLVPAWLVPDIDADITVEIRQEEGEEAKYRVSGSHDGFPAYELYINGERVYEHDPREAGKGPLALLPPSDISVNEPWQDIPGTSPPPPPPPPLPAPPANKDQLNDALLRGAEDGIYIKERPDDRSTNWQGEVYKWNPNGNKSDSFNLLAKIDLDSNRYGGRYGINADWGTGPVNKDRRLPSDSFVLKGFTEYYFQKGDIYDFQASGDDGYQIWVKTGDIGSPGGDERWYPVTPRNQWQMKDDEFLFRAPETGKSYVVFFHYEYTDDAEFELNWKKRTSGVY